MSSAISVSTISSRGGRAGKARLPKGAPPGYISAQTSARPAASSPLLSASDDLRQLTEAELARAGRAPDAVAPKALVPSGETRDIHRAGGRYVTLVGSNSW